MDGDFGSRELLSLLCEALAQELQASDCLVSRWNPVRSVTVGVAGFTGTPERWTLFAGEHELDRRPVTRTVLERGEPYSTYAGDRHGDRQELKRLQSMGLTAGLLLRLDAPGVPLLVEVWSDRRAGLFSRRERRRASRLVAEGARGLPAALERDRAFEEHFRLAAEDARSIGAADPQLAAMAVAIGEAMGLDEHALRELRLVALVHDVGRSAIPSALLEKREPLTPVEWAVVQRHTLVGQRMIARMPYLAEAVAGAGAIREWWNGEGYPAGLSGTTIPVSARIVTVCAASCALRGRPRGRTPPDHHSAMDEIERGAGSQFDPRVVRAMLAAVQPDGPRATVRLRADAI
jgi:HD-GYP domain-containing protein (c-di-GMP phosphodiesterase class II)